MSVFDACAEIKWILFKVTQEAINHLIFFCKLSLVSSSKYPISFFKDFHVNIFFIFNDVSVHMSFKWMLFFIFLLMNFKGFIHALDQILHIDISFDGWKVLQQLIDSKSWIFWR